MSLVMCHVSGVTRHMSRVTCHIFFLNKKKEGKKEREKKLFFILKNKLENVVELGGGGSVINGAYPV